MTFRSPKNRTRQVGCAAAAAMIAASVLVTAVQAQSNESVGVESQVSFMCADASGVSDPLVLGDLAGADGYVVESFAGESVWTLPDYWCNAPSLLTFELEPLTNQDVSGDGGANFTTRIDYSVSLSWNGASGAIHSDAASPTVIEADEAGVGDLVLTVSDPRTAAGRRLTAGGYAGAISITVTRQ